MLGLHPDIWRHQLREALRYWVIYPAAILGGGLLLDRVLALPTHRAPIAGTLALCLGLLIIWRSTADLARYGGGTASPFRPARTLVTKGMYAWCRHPMWLGYDLAAAGCILLAGSLSALLIAFPVFLILQLRFLGREERVLALRFQEEYTAYQRRTPLLIPLGIGRHRP